MKTLNFTESMETFNYHLSTFNISPMNEFKIRNKFGINGPENFKDLYEWALDYVSEMHSNECEKSIDF